MANISNSTSNTLIDGSSGADYIENKSYNVTIFAYNGNDTISNSGSSYVEKIYINAGKGNDSIYSSGSDYCDYLTVYGGEGNDTIFVDSRHNSAYSLIDGGTDNDMISVNNSPLQYNSWRRR